MQDIIIKNTKIVDDTGKRAFTNNIAIKDSKIVSIGNLDDMGDVTINGKGLVSCLGFIDPHNHADKIFILKNLWLINSRMCVKTMIY